MQTLSPHCGGTPETCRIPMTKTRRALSWTLTVKDPHRVSLGVGKGPGALDTSCLDWSSPQEQHGRLKNDFEYEQGHIFGITGNSGGPHRKDSENEE